MNREHIVTLDRATGEFGDIETGERTRLRIPAVKPPADRADPQPSRAVVQPGTRAGVGPERDQPLDGGGVQRAELVELAAGFGIEAGNRACPAYPPPAAYTASIR